MYLFIVGMKNLNMRYVEKGRGDRLDLKPAQKKKITNNNNEKNKK